MFEYRAVILISEINSTLLLLGIKYRSSRPLYLILNPNIGPHIGLFIIRRHQSAYIGAVVDWCQICLFAVLGIPHKNEYTLIRVGSLGYLTNRPTPRPSSIILKISPTW